eukprot:CAMPEP_0172566542 /NCGR_PEP_ID=MMETSP1067-20121228/112247_1 /TAXON_ID=265564 ORGANISM="Thalassiosira punctigera, Strain Tpunct2005C2" /NCGR_SAMPLE_ID=MMETSP1067 /ASSEMBLY_ACC=CAM_ASM_000444 /LENGTH=144 /DNA_ID=CAMNT_0013357685 /DNA_START=17 /DNA_END=448 /DNA_ORIENTATION=-
MASGQLKCAGSSLYLKKKYGKGYQLTIIKNPNHANELSGKEEKWEEDDADELEKQDFNAKKETTPKLGMDLNDILEGIVKGAVPSATLSSRRGVGTEISFQLPLGESAHFIEMFEKLDDQTRENRIKSYGVSVTTLDEVFLAVA